MLWCPRVLVAVRAAVRSLAPTHPANLALLTNAIQARRSLDLSELDRAYPVPTAQCRGSHQ